MGESILFINMGGSILFLFINVILCILVGRLGKNRKIGFTWSFIFSLLLSPLIGIIITLLSKKRDFEFVEVTSDKTPPTEE
ncbi:MAG: hypothetical protein MJZ17_00315 [Bacteroidales bacterium]|nr:hypothetical protein [Bacteroidales bacterium]